MVAPQSQSSRFGPGAGGQPDDEDVTVERRLPRYNYYGHQHGGSIIDWQQHAGRAHSQTM
jgi:hypothetical protein